MHRAPERSDREPDLVRGSADPRSDRPTVSVIIPCRNEVRFISTCLDSVIANRYPKNRLEVLVVDGMSDDGTREIVDAYAKRHYFVKLLNNPKKITPAALNLGITHAAGHIIVRMDSHARLRNDYISRAVESLYTYGADNVGGNMETLPGEEGSIAQAIVASLSHRFGVGNSNFRVHADKPKWVDTVFGGCYRREVFDRVGLFNEHLPRGQDMEFNRRLQKAGGTTLLVPDIVSYYYARSDLKSFWKHNFQNGIWAILPFVYSSVVPVSWRHIVPLLFVSSLTISAVLGLVTPLFCALFLATVGAYVLANLAASLQVASRERDFKYLAIMPLVFGMLHLGYGLGSLWGLVKLMGSRCFWNKLFGSRPDAGRRAREGLTSLSHR